MFHYYQKSFRSLFSIAFLFVSSFAMAQPTDDVAAMHETANNFLKKGDYENAILVLNKALQTKPDDLQITKDLLFAYYIKRDFVKAIEVGKPLVERDGADVQSFQMLGMTYKAIAEEKEADKLYKKGIKKFPTEGILYSEYGDLLSESQPETAIKLWEKGVEMDPNNANDYYFLAKKYAEKGNDLGSILHAETFLNMESFTTRSTEIKNLLLEQYKKFFVSAENTRNNFLKKGDAFSASIAETLIKQQSQLGYGITPESLALIRTRFVLDWYNTYNDRFPFRLFEHQRQLLSEGLFEAYNYWLFGPAANLKGYQTWQQYHQDQLNDFLGFIRSKVYKIPEGQHFRPS